MSEASEVSRVWGAVVRRWPVVLLCVVLGAAVFALWSNSRAPEVGYSASAKLRVADTGVPNMPTIDTVTSYANSAAIKAAVEASAGLDPKGVSIAGTADPKDKRGVVITAKAPSEEAATKWADAAAEQARTQALGMLAAPMGLEQAKITRLESRTTGLEKEIARVRALSAKATDPQLQATYLSLVSNLESLLDEAFGNLDQANYTLQGYRSWVMVTPTTGASKQTAEGVVLSDVLRGGLVGLFVGVLIAAFLENRRSASRG